jgi:hypothetical protein
MDDMKKGTFFPPHFPTQLIMSKNTRTICHLLVRSVSYGLPVLSDTKTVVVVEAQEFSSINENNHQLTLPTMNGIDM